MFIVGLTGGIGSGKTAVSDHLQSLGIDIVDADLASRTVVEPGQPALTQIAEHFGEEILLPDQSLDRAALRQKIFSKPADKQWLEALLHPLIAEEISYQLAKTTSPYALFVSPLLLEIGQSAICDRILVVDVPEAMQIARTTQRDNNDEEQVRRIIASQIPRQQRLEKADDIIENTQGLAELQQQAAVLHQHYLSLAEAKKHDG
ncbi:dephospho-CoA kinase [Oceanicoccus sagamiensis]|uniref:Dephospho-CoA kinase n=1 Tax=Oceanicoccus sagamiensis TaxID=716816 RepID=A0A1X9N7C3_9GAMM|nr:dephospho-CoA kinase [Oceanicoccus sagamiensis]ARN73034.1 dephospho-CoA kinase [Oceanicoccus sagamiensis]